MLDEFGCKEIKSVVLHEFGRKTIVNRGEWLGRAANFKR